MFGMKKQKSLVEMPHECNHIWKDFDWYTESTYYAEDKLISIRIIEPYVCVRCKKRKDVTFRNLDTYVKSYEESMEILEDFKKLYKNRIKDRAFIEDEINDFQLVDRETLEMLRKLNPSKYGSI